MTQTMNLSRMGLQEMSYQETTETEGGFVPLLILAAAVLLSGCITVDSHDQVTNNGSNTGNSGQGTGNSANNNGQNTGGNTSNGGPDSTKRK